MKLWAWDFYGMIVDVGLAYILTFFLNVKMYV